MGMLADLLNTLGNKMWIRYSDNIGAIRMKEVLISAFILNIRTSHEACYFQLACTQLWCTYCFVCINLYTY